MTIINKLPFGKIERFKKLTNEPQICAQEIMRHIHKPGRILDVGAGNGILSRSILEMHEKTEVVFVDPDFRGDLSIEKETLVKKKWEEYYPREKFDLIVFSHVVECLDKENRIKNVIRTRDYINPGGIIIIIENSPDSEFALWYDDVCDYVDDHSWDPLDTDWVNIFCPLTVEIFHFELTLVGIDSGALSQVADIFFPFPLDKLGPLESEFRNKLASIKQIKENLVVIK